MLTNGEVVIVDRRSSIEARVSLIELLELLPDLVESFLDPHIEPNDRLLDSRPVGLHPHGPWPRRAARRIWWPRGVLPVAAEPESRIEQPSPMEGAGIGALTAKRHRSAFTAAGNRGVRSDLRPPGSCGRARRKGSGTRGPHHVQQSMLYAGQHIHDWNGNPGEHEAAHSPAGGRDGRDGLGPD
jgi:hypothetical protein